MSTLELVVWSAMAGALLLLASAAVVGVVRLRSVPAWRGLSFVTLSGTSSIIMSGMPEYVLQIADPYTLLPFKLVLGPFSGAMSLVYLGNWLGLTREERVTSMAINLGSMASWIGGLVVLGIALTQSDVPVNYLLAASCLVTMVSPIVSIAASVRNALLGDSLAFWMAIGCGFLAVMVLGLYAKGLGIDAPVEVWALVAVVTVTFFVITTTLTILRTQNEKRLQRMARGNTGNDLVTGLSIGSVLMSKVDDAMWRSARMGRDSAVLAVWLNNLYDMNERGGQDVEHEIRNRLTATLRRAVGFKDVVGLTQTRCYIVVLSAIKDPAYVDKISNKILTMLPRPMRVGYNSGEVLVYTPELSVGVLRIPNASLGEPLQAMDQAVRLAQQALHMPGKILQAERSV